MSKRRRSNSRVVPGVAWYRREQWAALRELSVDSDTLEPTYDEWLEIAEEALRSMRKAGIDPRRIEVDVFDLKRWCDSQGFALDQSARARYAADVLSREGDRSTGAAG